MVDGETGTEAGGTGPGVQPLVIVYMCPSGDHEELARRVTELTEWAAREGLTVVDVLGDPDPDVAGEDRPAFTALLDRLLGIDAPPGVVVPSLDVLPGGEGERNALRHIIEADGGHLYVMPTQMSRP